MSEAAAQGASAILFPEMFLTGYMVWGRADELAEDLSGPSIRQFAYLARRHGLLTVFGFPEANPAGKPYNSACIVEATGEVLGSHRKVHLFSREPDFFSAGDEFRVFDTSIARVGLLICYDLEFPESARILALNGSELILVPTANMDPYQDHQRTYLRARSMENGVFIALSNTVGQDEIYTYCGESAVVDPEGAILSSAGREEEMSVSRINLARVAAVQASSPYLSRRRTPAYRDLVALPRAGNRQGRARHDTGPDDRVRKRGWMSSEEVENA